MTTHFERRQLLSHAARYALSSHGRFSQTSREAMPTYAANANANAIPDPLPPILSVESPPSAPLIAARKCSITRSPPVCFVVIPTISARQR